MKQVNRLKWCWVVSLSFVTASPGAAQAASEATIGAALPCGQLKGIVIPDSTINVDQMQDAVAADGMRHLSDTAFWTNLTTFFNRGSKLIFFHGCGDPWFSALDTVDYYERMAQASGGMEKVHAQSSRLFAVPGMGHCTSGNTLDRFDLLGALVNWVEDGKAPDAVTATGPAFPGRSRPLCAWPRYAHYTGRGNTMEASNFECR